MSKKHKSKQDLLNEKFSKIAQTKFVEPNPNQEPDIQIPGWADFIRRELKYSEAKTNNYHQVLMLAVLADKLERIALALEYKVDKMEGERLTNELGVIRCNTDGCEKLATKRIRIPAGKFALKTLYVCQDCKEQHLGND